MKTISAFCLSLIAINAYSDPVPLQELDAALQQLLDEDQRAFYGMPANYPVPKPYPKRKPLSSTSNLSLSKGSQLSLRSYPRNGNAELFRSKLQYPKPLSVATTPFGPPWVFVKNITLIPIKINYASPGDSAIPDSIYRSKIQGFNCTQQAQTIKGKITNSYKITRNAVVNSNIKSDSKFALGFPIGNTGATIGFDKTFSVGIGESVTTNDERSATDEDEINQQVPPNTKRTYKLERVVKTGYYYFDGTVLADGDLSPNPSPESSDPFWGLLSQKLIKPELKAPQRRTFHVSGYTWNASGVDKNFYWADEPLTQSQCADLVKSTGKQVDFISVSDNDSQLVASPLFNGMLVETANTSGDIFVRARSNSNQMCNVSFSTLDKSVSIKAPSKGWSDWTILTTYTGQASYSVNYTVPDSPECLTAVEPQIKYMRSVNLKDSSI